MSDLVFTLDQEKKDNQSFLVLHIRDKSLAGRILYADALQRAPEKELCSFLLKEHCKSLGITSLQAQTTPCSKIRLPASRSLDAIKLLALSKKLIWKDKSLFFNPFAKAKTSYVAEEIDPDSMSLSGWIEVDGKKEPLSSVEFFFPSDPIWCIKDRTVFVLPEDTDWKWIQRVYPETQILEKDKKQKFIKDFSEDEDSKIIWKGFNPQPIEKPLEALPYLVLQDTHGAFAILWMEYGTEKKVPFHDPEKTSWRNLSLEKSWEKDLLETDFCKKIVGTSHYYCPLDKVAKSLSFLLEVGWKIFDYKGRRVHKHTDTKLSISLMNDKVLTQGRISYEDHEIDVKNVVGAFNRREKFVELSPHAVGLMDTGKIEEDLGDFSEAEIIKEGLSLKKHQAGLLDAFLSKKNVRCDEGSVSLLERLKTASTESVSLPAESFKGTLYPYQQQGVNWLSFLYESGFSGLLADEMGLGKTVQVLAFFSRLETQAPILIVAPTSLLFNWKREWNTFVPGKEVYIHSGKDRLKEAEKLLQKPVILTSYAYLRIDEELLDTISYSCIVLDEAQMIKNPESQGAQAAYRLRASMKLAVTGTPVENKWDDLWSLFHFLEPELLGERKDFHAKMLASQADERFLKRIKKKVKPFLLRRTKAEVAKDLPEKILQTVWVEMADSQRSIYEEWLAKNRMGLLKKVKEDGVSSHRMEIFEAILRLRQICCHPHLVDSSLEGDVVESSSKLERVLADMEQVIEEGHKVLVFSQFTQMLKIIEKEVKTRGWGYSYLDGSTRNREEAVTVFQEDPNIPVFLMSLKAGGVGLNLTAADYVFLYDPWWNEAAEQQAMDRAHRYGRKDIVVARRYAMAESIEEKIMRLKEHKSALAKGLLEFDQEFSSLRVEDLLQLLD